MDATERMKKYVNAILSSDNRYLLLSEYRREEFDRVKYLYLEQLIKIKKALSFELKIIDTAKDSEKAKIINDTMVELEKKKLIKIIDIGKGNTINQIFVEGYSFPIYNIRSASNTNDYEALRFLQKDEVTLGKVIDGSIRYVHPELNAPIFKRMTNSILRNVKKINMMKTTILEDMKVKQNMGNNNTFLNILYHYNASLFVEEKFEKSSFFRIKSENTIKEALNTMLTSEVYLTLLLRGNNIIMKLLRLDSDVPYKIFASDKNLTKDKMNELCKPYVARIKQEKLSSDNQVIISDQKQRLESLKSYFEKNYTNNQPVFYSPENVVKYGQKHKKYEKYVSSMIRYEEQFYDTYCFLIATLIEYSKPYILNDDIVVTIVENANGSFNKIEKYPVRDEYVRFILRTFNTCKFERNYMYPALIDRSKELLTNSIKKYFTFHAVIGDYFYTAIYDLLCHIINVETKSSRSREENIKRILKKINRFFRSSSKIEYNDNYIASKLYTLAVRLKYFVTADDAKVLDTNDIEAATRMIIFPENFVLVESDGNNFSGKVANVSPYVQDNVHFDKCCTIIKNCRGARLSRIVD